MKNWIQALLVITLLALLAGCTEEGAVILEEDTTEAAAPTTEEVVESEEELSTEEILDIAVYNEEFDLYMVNVGDAIGEAAELTHQGGLDISLMTDEQWISEMIVQLSIINSENEKVGTFTVPEGREELDRLWILVAEELSLYVQKLASGIDNLDGAQIEASTRHMDNASSYMGEMITEMDLLAE